MLKNLNKATFSQFGTVSGEGISIASARLGENLIKSREISFSNFNKLYIHRDEKTVLDIVVGNAILFAGLTPDDLTAFLLDKTVIINENVYYYVVPLLDSACIAVSESCDPEIVSISPMSRPQKIIPVISPIEIYTFFYHEKEKGFRFKGETHNFWELTYVDRGEMYNTADGKKYKLSPGNCMIFAPGQFHTQYAPSGVSVCYITVCFKMTEIDRDLLCDTVFAPDDDIKALIGRMLAENESGRIFSDDLLLSYLKEIIILLARTKRVEKVIKTSFTPAKQRMEQDITDHAKQYIRRNISKRLSIADIAKSIPVSSGYLSMLFKRKTGETLNSYITRKKMELAKAYIRENKYSFTQIADMTGYQNIHYFSACFKKSFGITPTEYAGSVNSDL